MKITVENVTKELKDDDDAYDDDESYILGYSPMELKGSHQVIRCYIADISMLTTFS